MQQGDIFQGLTVVRVDGTYTQLEYPKGHPRRVYVEQVNAEYERKGEGWRVPRAAFIIPTPTKTGLPNRRDVVGRFLAGLCGESGRYYTNGCAIFSYGEHWRMLYRGKNDEFLYDDNMFRKPYSSMTSGHMSAVSSDPRLFGKIANKEKFPKRLERELVEAATRAILDRYNMQEFGTALYNVGPAPAAVIARVFRALPKAIREQFASDRRALAQVGAKRLRQQYKAETIAQYRAFLKEAEPRYLAMVAEYEKRYRKPYGEKMPPIPIRTLPVKPQLMLRLDDRHFFIKNAKRGILAWHFLPEDRKLRFRDERVVEVGETLSVSTEKRGEEIALCNHGLHGSENIKDAFGYFSGAVLCRTLHHGVIDRGYDKIASEHRVCLGMINLLGKDERVRDLSRLLHTYENNRAEIEAAALKLLGMTATQRTPSIIGMVGFADDEEENEDV